MTTKDVRLARAAVLVMGSVSVWLLAGPVGLAMAAALAGVLWLEVYTDAGLGA